jgi:NTP pyrophosphatase (non-canonical NTP hydrolase)
MKKIEEKILKHLQARKWDNLRPSDIAKSIMIEGAELLELFQWESSELETVKKDKEKIEAIKKELADVLIYCIEMSVLLGLDTEKIIRTKLAAVAKKYPAKLIKQSKQESDPERVYLKIKKEYRMKGL